MSPTPTPPATPTPATTPAPRPVSPQRAGRLAREQRTLELMLGLYCAGQHHRQVHDCPDCTALQHYARARLAACRHDPKPQCQQCPTHCYAAAKREQMKQVMRYAGPRMLLRHPLLTLRHWLD